MRAIAISLIAPTLPGMRSVAVISVFVAGLVGFGATLSAASSSSTSAPAPIFGIKLPPGYRDWRLISVAQEAGSLDDLRAILGNDIAIKAYRQGKLPFPDGAVIARLAWSYTPSEENDQAFGRTQSHIAGPPKNGVQFMVKNSRKYAATGGWGFAQFDDGKPASEAKHATCFPCHDGKGRDIVFTRYSP